MPVVFSEYVPSLLGVRTFHTELVLPSVTFEILTTGIAGISLTKLLWNQTPFFILFLISLIPGIWMLRGNRHDIVQADSSEELISSISPLPPRSTRLSVIMERKSQWSSAQWSVSWTPITPG